MKLTIEQLSEKEITWNDKKTGQPKSAMKIGVRSGDNWYGCFEKKGITDSWQVGDEIDVEVESREYNGQTYYDIKHPNAFAAIEARLIKLEKALRIGSQLTVLYL